jgi:hypothetical protein
MASAVNSTMAWAQTRPATPAPAPADTARRDSAQAAAGPPPISEEARILATVVQRRYGKHLSEQQLEAVTREIDNRLQGGERLRKAALVNSDEPDIVFRAG